MTTYFKSSDKFRQKLVLVKDKQPKEKCSHIFYGIKCDDLGCSETYVGDESYHSAVFTHLHNFDHSFKKFVAHIPTYSFKFPMVAEYTIPNLLNQVCDPRPTRGGMYVKRSTMFDYFPE